MTFTSSNWFGKRQNRSETRMARCGGWFCFQRNYPVADCAHLQAEVGILYIGWWKRMNQSRREGCQVGRGSWSFLASVSCFVYNILRVFYYSIIRSEPDNGSGNAGWSAVSDMICNPSGFIFVRHKKSPGYYAEQKIGQSLVVYIEHVLYFTICSIVRIWDTRNLNNRCLCHKFMLVRL